MATDTHEPAERFTFDECLRDVSEQARLSVYVLVRCDRLQLCMRNLRYRQCARQWYAVHAAVTATATPKHANDFGFVWLCRVHIGS